MILPVWCIHQSFIKIGLHHFRSRFISKKPLNFFKQPKFGKKRNHWQPKLIKSSLLNQISTETNFHSTHHQVFSNLNLHFHKNLTINGKWINRINKNNCTQDCKYQINLNEFTLLIIHFDSICANIFIINNNIDRGK